MRQAPKERPIARINSRNDLVHENDQLVLPGQANERWGRVRILKILPFPADRSVILVEGHDSMSWTTYRNDHKILVSQWTRGVAPNHHSTVKFPVEIVRPYQSARRFF